ncbi:hypothetical protein BDY17DRAFT_299920 [Neohortaea acidophila]|uniref:Uncharacterized protein n=1 Tax=Neohortaea acidophila TaxID=245834 RepID=A0A6A6PQK8_9PEZI|nr:uncharacterized protein BDY17DRAFT_299920 [Neohortaea acidophila]KAF2481914.1 hypothetical protein BDY17DRAFT_299920 [Neohortaea acidophila]
MVRKLRGALPSFFLPFWNSSSASTSSPAFGIQNDSWALKPSRTLISSPRCLTRCWSHRDSTNTCIASAATSARPFPRLGSRAERLE